MTLASPPAGVSLERLTQIEYHVDVKLWPWGVRCSSCGRKIEPKIKWNAIGDDWQFTMPPPVGANCECGGVYRKGDLKFIAFVYRGGLDIEPHESLGACVDVGSAWVSEKDATEDARKMIEKHRETRKRMFFVVSR